MLKITLQKAFWWILSLNVSDILVPLNWSLVELNWYKGTRTCPSEREWEVEWKRKRYALPWASSNSQEGRHRRTSIFPSKIILFAVMCGTLNNRCSDQFSCFYLFSRRCVVKCDLYAWLINSQKLAVAPLAWWSPAITAGTAHTRGQSTEVVGGASPTGPAVPQPTAANVLRRSSGSSSFPYCSTKSRPASLSSSSVSHASRGGVSSC